MNAFEKSILHVYHPSMSDHAKNNLTELNCTTGAYVSKSPSWRSPIIQYLALNFLKVRSGDLLTLKTQVPGSTFVVAASMGTSSQQSSLSNCVISLMAD